MTMTCTAPHQRVTQVAAISLLLLATGGLTGCDLLGVTNPTRLEVEDVANPDGADRMRRHAMREFYTNVSQSAAASGALADEFIVNLTFLWPGDLDLRSDNFEESQVYVSSHEVRHATTLALSRIAEDAPPASRSAHMGQMLAVRGYVTMRLGEDFCAGFPLHELDGFAPVLGEPLTTEQVFRRALADLDSAVALTADSARILNLARVAQGRTLLGLGRLADAADAVAAVPTDYVFNAEYDASGSGHSNVVFDITALSSGASVPDREGGNGLDFISADDPRVQTTLFTAFNGTVRYHAAKYPDWDAPMVLASGVEARLIEAEAALGAGGPWLEILNDLRETHVSPAMEPLSDPGSEDARVDLLFRERAFWLFGTGHRLSDLRRLMRQYGRPSEALFPTGVHFRGEDYGTATSMRFPWETEAQFNPAVTGCTSP